MTVAAPPVLTHAAEAWSAFYDDHRILQIAVLFAHVAGLVLGAGAALAADRAILAAARGTTDRPACLAELARTHRVVTRALALVVLSGMLLTLTDLETFLASRVFYLKGAFFVLLLVNGLVLLQAERRAERAAGERAWRTLRASAIASSVLWLATILLGVWLTKAA